jgi:hypothetical protein
VASQSSGKRLEAVLWFVAAGLAFIAVAISYVGDHKSNLGVAAGGLFCLIMGVTALLRQHPPSH